MLFLFVESKIPELKALYLLVPSVGLTLATYNAIASCRCSTRSLRICLWRSALRLLSLKPIRFLLGYFIMNSEKLVITLFAEDRPGVVRLLSDTILEHSGNWLESSLSRLCGQFAGIIHIGVSEPQCPQLIAALDALSADGLNVTVHSGVKELPDSNAGTAIELIVEANDRPGIVEEISSALAKINVNVEQMETSCESASMAGYQIFIGSLWVSLPDGCTTEHLEQALEDVSDDLIVSIVA
jgi:glycine cleavage system regulatory protein